MLHRSTSCLNPFEWTVSGMNREKFVSYRKRLGLTQKALAQLLVVSIRTIHSYEQGFRNIPGTIARQLLFLVFQQKSPKGDTRPCWLLRSCPAERKKQCPAWKFKNGQLCWFLTGTLCEGQVSKTWEEKLRFCEKCEVFPSYLHV